MPDLVWYASYGSNLLRARFLLYLTGGQAQAARTLGRRYLITHDQFQDVLACRW